MSVLEGTHLRRANGERPHPLARTLGACPRRVHTRVQYSERLCFSAQASTETKADAIVDTAVRPLRCAHGLAPSRAALGPQRAPQARRQPMHSYTAFQQRWLALRCKPRARCCIGHISRVAMQTTSSDQAGRAAFARDCFGEPSVVSAAVCLELCHDIARQLAAQSVVNNARCAPA